MNPLKLFRIFPLLAAGLLAGGCQTSNNDAVKGLQSHSVEQIIASKNISNPKLLRALSGRGDNLSKRRDVDHTFYAYTESDQLALSNDLQQMGFSVDKGLNDDGSFWIDATIAQSPNEAVTSEFVTKLANLCVKHKSDYDGWATHITP